MANVSVRYRALWVVVTGLGVFVVVAMVVLLRVDQVQHQQDRDMCALIGALLPSAQPTPVTSYGKAQRDALVRYRASRCR